MDQTTTKAVGDAALGIKVSAQWNTDLDNPANKEFMAAWTKAYNRLPTYYASQGYDTAKLIASALKATNGKVDDDAFVKALKKADFSSVRGKFKFGNNNHPIQDWYALEVVKGADGQPTIKTVGKIFQEQGDVYAKDCKL